MTLGEPMTKEERRTWGLDHGRCEVCGIPWQLALNHRFPEYLETHHILGGPNRKDYHWNLIRTCSRCHRHYHNGGERGLRDERIPDLTLGHLLAAKKATGDWRPDCLKALRARALPDLLPLPELLLEEQAYYGYQPKEHA